MITEAFTRGIAYLSGTSNPDEWLISWASQGEPSSAGEFINEKNALKVPAVKACVSTIAESFASMRLDVYEELKSGRVRQAADHPLQAVVSRAFNDETTSYVARHTAQIHAATWGNAYLAVQRNFRGDAIGLWGRSPEPERTKPARNTKDGRLYYLIRDQNGQEEKPIPAADMIHIKPFSEDGIIGKSLVKMFKDSIGGNKAAERYANEMFKNGGSPQGYLKHPGRLSEPAYARLKKAQAEKAQHGSRHGIGILEEGMEFQGTSMRPAEVQMVDVRKFLITEIERIWNIPPHMIQDLEKASLSNVTEMNRQFITQTMMPWLMLWLGEMNFKLLKPPYFFRVNLEDYLRGDQQAMANTHRVYFNIGALSINDIRHRIGENSIDNPNADEYFVPLNMVPLSKATDPEWIARGKGGADKKPKPGGVHPGDGVTAPLGQMEWPVETISEQPGSQSEMLQITHEKSEKPDDDVDARFAEILVRLDKLRPPENTSALEAAEQVLREANARMEKIEASVALRAAKEPATFTAKLDEFYATKYPRVRREALHAPMAALIAAGGQCQSEEDAIDGHIRWHRELLEGVAGYSARELPGHVAKVVENWGKA